uniref:Uncharacterized protein n=1 Tax=viral metagenome TaxID=1070528 RepID=A0A6H1ZDU6_9ZZZZ
MRIFVVVKYQLIMGFSGAVAINQTAIHEAMRLYKIEKRKECFEKLLTLGAWWIERLREDAS